MFKHEQERREKSSTPVAKSITPSGNNRQRNSPRPNSMGQIPPNPGQGGNVNAAAAAAAAAAALQGYPYNLQGLQGNLAGYANELMSQAAAAAMAAGGQNPMGPGGMPMNYRGGPPFPGGMPPQGFADPNARISIPGMPSGKP
jgi:hypothetical protein